MPPSTHRSGLLYGLGAYGLWGLIPLYFKAVAQVPPLEILAHRVVWSCAFLGITVVALRRGRSFRAAIARPDVRRTLSITTVLIAVNWFTFIYAVMANQMLQASLGYFITPLVNVALGVAYLHERLRPWQLAAVVVASAGVANLVLAAGQFPWIALVVAGSFAFYGMLRKTVEVDGLNGLWAETLLLLPPALATIGYFLATGQGQFGQGTAAGSTAAAPGAWNTTALLMASGVVTSVPLLLFTAAARRLPLATLGLLQYLAPSVQFALAVTVFGEPFNSTQLASFGCIWLALAIYTIDSLRAAAGARLATAR
ncbi:MAG: EamA family transporter RarD [Pirellulales bacterium]|nr:EamA family transporter RarD [Pirellulales bacterium]